MGRDHEDGSARKACKLGRRQGRGSRDGIDEMQVVLLWRDAVNGVVHQAIKRLPKGDGILQITRSHLGYAAIRWEESSQSDPIGKLLRRAQSLDRLLAQTRADCGDEVETRAAEIEAEIRLRHGVVALVKGMIEWRILSPDGMRVHVRG